MTIDIEILQFLHYHPLANRAEIMAGLTKDPSDSGRQETHFIR